MADRGRESHFVASDHRADIDHQTDNGCIDRADGHTENIRHVSDYQHRCRGRRRRENRLGASCYGRDDDIETEMALQRCFYLKVSMGGE